MRGKFNIIFNTYCFRNQNCKTSHPLPSVIKAKHKLCLSQMRCRSLIYGPSPLKDWDAGITADENIWFGWVGRQNPGRRVSKHQQMLPSRRHPNGGIIAAAALTPHVSLWWQQCLCLRGWWQNRTLPRSPQTDTQEHEYSYTGMHACARTHRCTKLGEVCLP